MADIIKKKKKFFRKMKQYDNYYRRTGFYKFLIQNFIKLTLILLGIAALLILANYILLYYGFNLGDSIKNIVQKSSTPFVLMLFFVSESILGWIPPDFFIAWSQYEPTSFAYFNLTIIATISYAGGFVAYWIGIWIRQFPRVNQYIEHKYASRFLLIKKWGGLVIVMAALFPLPFATTSTAAGIVKYPFKLFVLYGLTRYFRFYSYALVIFWGLN